MNEKQPHVSMVFWSPWSGKSFKAPRVKMYVEEFQKHSAHLDFYGILDKKSKKYSSSFDNVECYAFSSCNTYAALATKVSDPLGRGSFGRYIGAHCLSRKAMYSSNFLRSDVLFTQPYFWPAVKYAKKNNIPVVLEVDSSHPLENWNIIREREQVNHMPRRKYDKWNFFPYVKMAMRSIDAADKVIVFSDHAEETFLDRGFEKHKLLKLRPPIGRQIKQVVSIPKEPKFVFVSNHSMRKGLDIVLQAWDMYVRRGNRGMLYICGKITPSVKIVLSNFQNLKRVKFLGHISLDDFFAKEKCVLLSPSFSEGRPRTVLEAIMSGNPVIASHAGSADIVDDGVSGFLVDTNAESLYKSLVKIDKMWDTISVFDGGIVRKQEEELRNLYFQSVYEVLKLTSETYAIR